MRSDIFCGRHAFLRRGGCSFFLLCVVLLSGCASVVRMPAVPISDVNAVRVVGFPASIRFWGDEAPADIDTSLRQMVSQYVNANQAYFDTHGQYPVMSYLALSGGAYDGAFGAGLLKGWTQAGQRPQFALVSGVSTGALIAPFAFVGSSEDARVETLFTKTNSEGIFVSGIMTLLKGILGGLSVTQTTPLEAMIERNVTPAVMQAIAKRHQEGNRLYIATTNIEARRSMIWDIGAIACSGNPQALSLIHQIMLASSSVPGLFNPVFFDVTAGGKTYQEIHVDGGVTSNVFLYPLKLRKGSADAFKQYGLKRRLYVVRNNKVKPDYAAFNPNIYSITRSALETLINAQGVGDLYRLYFAAKRDDMDFNLVAIPESFQMQTKELFDPVYMSALFSLGQSMGQKEEVWQKLPPGAGPAPEVAVAAD
jgi:predicted patatin/cPLA2 family phospholipase